MTQAHTNLPFEPLDVDDATDVQKFSGDRSKVPNCPDVDDAELVRQTLREIMVSDVAPAAAKAQAARTMAEMAQLLGRNQCESADTSTPVKELTHAAMLAELGTLAGG